MFSFIRRPDGKYVAKTNLRGRQVYREPLLNKGTAFTREERRRLGVEALLPDHQMTIEQQAERTMRLLARLTDPLDKMLELEQVRDRNEHLFYRILKDHLVELMPIIYTPTVAKAVRLYSTTFRRAHGVWITPSHRGRIADVLADAIGERRIRLMVITDNESILGIGDQGAGGIAISNGKIALYCAGAGIHPAEALAVSFDVGTNNEELLQHATYVGVRSRRMRGEEYYSLLEETVEAIRQVAPAAIVQWEDFRHTTAVTVLERFLDRVPSFNDDIQGTGAIGLTGVLVGCDISGVPLTEQRIVVHGGGAAGYGIAQQIMNSLTTAGLSPEEAAGRVAVLDSRGLIMSGSNASAPYKDRIAWSTETAARHGLGAGAELAEVVTKFRPTVLIGTSGQPKSFTRPIVETMLGYCERPVIMPMSNPNDLCEADPADLLAWTNGRALVGCGSPFPPVEIAGRSIRIGQGNNVFIFPAIGLAALVTRTSRIDDDWLTTAAWALAEAVTEEEKASGLLYPDIARLPEVLGGVAAKLVAKLRSISLEEARAEVARAEWQPVYPTFE